MPPRKYTAENNRIARARFAKESRDPKRDIARKAKMAKSIDDYDPRRNDWKGVDTPGSSLPGKGGRGQSGAAAAWRAHVMATHRQMGGSLKDAMRAASKTWIKKGGDPFTNFMAAGGTGVEAPVTAPLPAIPAQYKAAKPLPSIPVTYGPAKKPLPGIPAPVTVPLPVISTNTAGFEDIPSPVYNDAIDDEEGFQDIPSPVFKDAIDDEEGFQDFPDQEFKDAIDDEEGFRDVPDPVFRDAVDDEEGFRDAEEEAAIAADIANDQFVDAQDDNDYQFVDDTGPAPAVAVSALPTTKSIQQDGLLTAFGKSLRATVASVSLPMWGQTTPPPPPLPQKKALPPLPVAIPAQDDNDAFDANTFEGWQKTTMGVSDDAYVQACARSKFRTVAQLKNIVGSHYDVKSLMRDYPPIGMPATKNKTTLLGKLNKSHLCVFLAKIGGNAREFGISKGMNQKVARKKNP